LRRLPSRFAIFARTLLLGRENNRANDGMGSAAPAAVVPPYRLWLTRRLAAKDINVSTGLKSTWRFPVGTGPRANSASH
jgi:hypothetical protein